MSCAVHLLVCRKLILEDLPDVVVHSIRYPSVTDSAKKVCAAGEFGI